MGWGGGVREQASVKCTTHRLPHKNLPNNNKQKQERRGRKKCIITVLRFFDSARTSNGTKQKMRQNGTTGGKKNYKRLSQTQTLHHYFFPRAIYKANAIQAKARRPPYAWMNCGGSKLSWPLPHRWKIWEGKKKRRRGDSLDVQGAIIIISSFAREKKKANIASPRKWNALTTMDTQRKKFRDRSKLENNEILQYFFPPTALVPSITRRKQKERRTSALCTITMCLWHDIFTMQWQRRCAD